MAYEQGDLVNPEVMPYVDAFGTNAKQGYAQDMGQVRRGAQAELDAEISGGDQQGRQAGYQRRATDQLFSDQQDKFNKGVALQGAELGETLRQRGQARSWDVRDRDERLYQLRKIAEQKRNQANDEATGGANKEIGSGIGTILGAGVAGYYSDWNPQATVLGGAAGGVAGGTAGSYF